MNGSIDPVQWLQKKETLMILARNLPLDSHPHCNDPACSLSPNASSDGSSELSGTFPKPNLAGKPCVRSLISGV